MARLTRREEIDNCPGIWVQEGFANEGLQTWFNGYDEGYSAINKCAEYEDAEEQGLLIKLPCKVGDKAWYVRNSVIDEVEVDSFILNTNLFIKVSLYVGYERFRKTLTPYKTLFFTREEAEQALKKMESEG